MDYNEQAFKNTKEITTEVQDHKLQQASLYFQVQQAKFFCNINVLYYFNQNQAKNF